MLTGSSFFCPGFPSYLTSSFFLQLISLFYELIIVNDFPVNRALQIPALCAAIRRFRSRLFSYTADVIKIRSSGDMLVANVLKGERFQPLAIIGRLLQYRMAGSTGVQILAPPSGIHCTGLSRRSSSALSALVFVVSLISTRLGNRISRPPLEIRRPVRIRRADGCPSRFTSPNSFGDFLRSNRVHDFRMK